MENADSIKIEKFKSLKDVQLSSEQQSTVKESKQKIVNNNCFFAYWSLSANGGFNTKAPLGYASAG